MTPFQHSLYSRLPPPSDGNDHHQAYLHPFLRASEAASFPCAIFLSPRQEGSSGSDHHHHSQHQQRAVKEQYFLPSGTSDHSSPPGLSMATGDDDECRHKDDATEGDPSNSGPAGKWTPSKMRIIRKMMGSDRISPSKPGKSTLELQDHQRKYGDSKSSSSNNSNSNDISPPIGTLRVCSNCSTTKTPLWRSGPRGPKSLCNACGIRQRKARRAMAAAAALTSGGTIPEVAPAKVRKEKKSGGDCAVPFKKRFGFAAAQTRKKLPFDELATGSSKSSAFQRVFPQDEKEAAILLMALSCGLIHG